MTRTAICFGEALVDCFPDRRVVGGAALHVAVHLARLGWHAGLVTRVGADPDGEAVRRLLRERGVDLAWVEIDASLPTGTVQVTLDGGEPEFAISDASAWDAIEGPERPPDAELFVHGTLAARAAPSRAALGRLRAALPGALVVCDANLRPPHVHPDVVRDAVEGAHVLRLNAAEASAVARAFAISEEPGAWFSRLPRLRRLCITRGRDGASLHAREGGTWTLAAPEVAVVDTVGAGDAFTAGLADALARGLDGVEALACGRRLSAQVLARRGGLA